MRKKSNFANQPRLFEDDPPLPVEGTTPQRGFPAGATDPDSIPFTANDTPSAVPEPMALVTGDHATTTTSVPTSPDASVYGSGNKAPKESLSPGDLVIVVDSHSLIYQVFHALPSMTSPSGMEVGAVHGFLRDVIELIDQWQPDFLVCAFDESEVTFRNALYDQYKANRDPMPEALRAQMPLIHSALETLGVSKLSMPGFEADDILATIAKASHDGGAKCLLVTSDKDCRQLLSEHVQMLNLRKNQLYGVPELAETWGIKPEQVVDFQAMVGDSVDNVPGVPQIGPKAAQQLLSEFESLDGIYANLDRVPGAKRQETLREHHEKAYLSRDLVRLKNDTPIEWNWPQWSQQNARVAEVEALFQSLGFRRLAERFLKHTTSEHETASPPPQVIDRSLYRCIVSDASIVVPGVITQTLSDFASEIQSYFASVPPESRYLAIDTETTSVSPRHAELVGYSLCWSPGQAVYLPILAPNAAHCLNANEVKEVLRPLLLDPTIAKIGQNIKYDLVVLRGESLEVVNIASDTMVADYLLDAGSRNHNLDDLAKRHLSHETIRIDALIGSGKDQRKMDQVDVDAVAIYAAEDVDVPYRLRSILEPKLIQESLESVYRDIELPLLEVLAEMEFNGITIDPVLLGQLSDKMATKIDRLKIDIETLAGESFNPDSPKQLAAILFDKLKLRVVKKTKTGASTDVEVLQELASEHPLPAKIVEYRQAAKLKSTYIDALPKLVCEKTGRVHTSFRQDVAATGRLSSTDPNLQNIPIRTEEGREIRSAFLPGPDGWMLMTADYSQIELRVLAHYCGDESLRNAFLNDEDIHTRVAAEIHGVDLMHVTKDMRRGAKAVNFGILYGQSPFGLAKALNISKGEAAEFIDAYFERYQSVRQFMYKVFEDCRRDGFVTTISGRKRFLKGIRNFATLTPQQQKTLLEPERMAVNTVIQGSAADLIKIAMIGVHRRLKQTEIAAKILLQIHDELVFEVAPHDIEKLSTIVREEMSSAVKLDVPLNIDIKVGKNWASCDAI
ncbi:MAG: DNA polymerase I [Planctomycetota bacterium]|nr:DNA polymerase I [Planctomycetota bacterium]